MGTSASVSFDIRQHQDALTPDGGSQTNTEKSFHCPVCGAKNFKICQKTGKFYTFGCDCASTEQGKRGIRDAIAPLNWEKPPRPRQRRDWTYCDRDGQQMIRVVRTDDGEGHRKIWQESLVQGKEPAELIGQSVPYRYQECLKAIANDQRVFWVEGEGVADALWALEIPATTTIRGSGGYSSRQYAGLFPGAQIVICPDRDQAGIKYAEAIADDYPDAQWLYAYPSSYLWERLPSHGGADLADWIEDGAAIEQLMAAIGPKRDLDPKAKQQQQLFDEEPPRKEPPLARQYRAVEAAIGDRLRLNKLTQQVELDGEPLSFEDVELRLALEFGIKVSARNAQVIVANLANRHAYSPIAQYLTRVSELYGPDTQILDNLATRYFGTTAPLYDSYLKRTLISAVARALNPGCKVDTTLILQGAQGAKKSTFFSVLAGPGCFDDSMGAISDKDERLKLHTAWLVEWAELETVFKRRDVASVKAFLSCAVDNIRPPYGRTVQEMKRPSIIVGTTNKDEFLGDSTGNRRFWVIPVQAAKIDIAMLEQERDRIWAAAVAAYRAGEIWWLSDEEEALSAVDTDQYSLRDPWEAELASYAENRPSLAIEDFLTAYLNIERKDLDRRSTMRVADILRSWGWTKRKETLGGQRRWVWSLKPEVGQAAQEVGQAAQEVGHPTAIAQNRSPERNPPTVQPFDHPQALTEVGQGLAISETPLHQDFQLTASNLSNLDTPSLRTIANLSPPLPEGHEEW